MGPRGVVDPFVRWSVSTTAGCAVSAPRPDAPAPRTGELTGRPEDWERYATPVPKRRIAAAEATHPAGGDVQLDLSREVSVGLVVRLYRGLGAAGVIRVAERLGWQGAQSGTTAEPPGPGTEDGRAGARRRLSGGTRTNQ
ncbi:hypothetical protein [Kitasatospora sp. NPDC056531]|uniref:hypothetical protein n=1 Tax=Kitasatospora sp. NPDC056531 TaxID=3345856 RepID=UPI0036C48EC9